jgi:hypothetical protein
MNPSSFFIVLALWALFLTPVTALSQATPGSGLAGSDHDFSGIPAGTGVTTGLCTFCHTPHKAVQTRLLWNHTLSQNTFFWSDTLNTVGGTPLPLIPSTWSGPTKYCLSCHDGSVAVGDIFWFNASAWQGAAALDTEKHSTGPYNIATPTGDMKGNHPVAAPYPYNAARNTYNATTTGLSVPLGEYAADPIPSGIRLFNDSTGFVVAGPVAGRSGMECSSCHDPHNGTAVVDKHFLLGSIGGNGPDYICVKCHQK